MRAAVAPARKRNRRRLVQTGSGWVDTASSFPVSLRSRQLFGVSAFGTDLGLRIMEGLGLVAVT